MTFDKLIKKLDKFSFEEIVEKYNVLYGMENPVECYKNIVYDDDDLREFLEKLGAQIYYYNHNTKSAIIVTTDDEYYEVPYECRKNRSGDDLPDETILFFDKDGINDVTESLTELRECLLKQNIWEKEIGKILSEFDENVTKDDLKCLRIYDSAYDLATDYIDNTVNELDYYIDAVLDKTMLGEYIVANENEYILLNTGRIVKLNKL